MRTLERPRASFVPVKQTVVWHPLAKQQLERDTTFLLDGSLETGYAVGEGAFIPITYADTSWHIDPALGQPGAHVAVVDGKYRKGFQALTAPVPRGAVWLPSEGLLGEDEFTIEFFAKTVASNWSAGGVPFQIGTSLLQPGFQEGIWIGVTGGVLQANIAHQQAGSVSAAINRSLSGGSDLAPGTFHNIALTYDGDRFTFYFDRVEVGHVVGVAPPKQWGGGSNEGGLRLGNNSPDWVVSDLRISRRARVPGQAIVLNGHTALTIDPATPTGKTVEPNLLGVLHNITHDVVAHDSATDTAVTAKFANVVRTLRTDKMLNATPIKAGGTDGSHPSLGHSGSYSYDWQVVDRTVAYAQARGLELYINLDSTPQLLGGGSPPFSGTDLTTKMSGEANFNDQVPNDLTAFATICVDLVHHIKVDLGATVERYGVWNEPERWTLTDYCAMYAAIATAVKAYDAAIKIGGPECNPFDQTQITGLIAYCGANDVPLDFISWHFYSGQLSEVAYARLVVDQAAASAGLGTLELLNGEWEGAGGILEVKPPGWNSYMHADVWGAAWLARAIVEFQRYDVVRAVMLWAIGKDAPDGIAPPPTGLLRRSDLKPWATFNVYRLRSMMKPTEVEVTAMNDRDPGIAAIAATDSSNGLDVFVVSLHHRRDHDYGVDLHGLDAYDGQSATVYIVDDRHSNLHDAGDAHAELESYSAGPVSGGSLSLRLRPNAAALVRLS